MKIKSIHATSFMGQSFDQDIGKYNLFVGPMGSGKSSRAYALMLARDGNIKGIKANPELFRSFGPNKSINFYVGFTLQNGKKIERKYQRSRSGSISAKFQVNGSHNVSKEMFYDAVSDAPTIFNVSEFMDSSDKAKIDFIFRMFPPTDPDVLNIDRDLEKLNAELLQKQEAIRTNEKMIQKLQASKKDQDLPPGTLPRTRDEIKKTASEIAEVQENIKKFEIKAAEDKARAEAEKKKDFRKSPLTEGLDSLDEYMKEQRAEAESKMIKKFGLDKRSPDPAVAAIQKIIDTIKKTECDVCAVLMVATKELKALSRFPDKKTLKDDIRF